MLKPISTISSTLRSTMRSTMRGILPLVFCLTTISSAQANEVDYANSILKTNSSIFCETKSEQQVVNPKKLFLWLLDVVDVSDAAMDLNGDGSTLYQEKVALIAEPDELSKCEASGRCNDLDKDKIIQVQNIIKSLWSPAPPNPFTTRFLPGREGSGSSINVRTFLSNDSGIQSVCPPIEPNAESLSDSNKKDTSSKASESWSERLILRERPEDIIKPFKEGAPANFSYELNELTNTKDLEVDLVAALLISENFEEQHSSQYFAYFQSDTDIQKVKGVNSSSSRRALSLGAIAEYRLGSYDSYFSNHLITINPSYTSDAIQDSDSLNFIGTWTPIPDLGENNFFLNMVPIGPYLDLKVNWDLRLEGGSILNQGKQASIEKDYADYGYNINVIMNGAKNSILAKFQWDSSYKKLYSLLSGQRSKEYLSSKLRYLINTNLSLGVGYEKGQKGVQFNEVDKWNINFGAKF
ncbi:hypothetical protein A3765_08765 [Oleiphilus sp. HI0130]|nr:hypothetical protein A3758_01630 [Oleiphilus sp. HI0118]KZZ77724.1 hypothetical protein A3765_08765 [Oleiphilus sp. HI0130]